MPISCYGRDSDRIGGDITRTYIGERGVAIAEKVDEGEPKPGRLETGTSPIRDPYSIERSGRLIWLCTEKSEIPIPPFFIS